MDGGRGKVQRLAVTSNRQELEEHKKLAPKVSQSEGFLSQSLTMFTSKKKTPKVWKYH